MTPPTSSKKNTTPPPVSLSACWDKGKWHFEAASFPAHLPRSVGWAHIVAALRFLDDRGQLTAEGKRELAQVSEEIALLSGQIKPGARAFLDQSYEAYLSALEGYGKPLPIHVLESAWHAYIEKYDLSKRPRPNTYQQLLLDHASDHTADALLRVLDGKPGFAASLRAALAEVPAKDRALVEATLAAREGDPVTLASSWPDPVALLHALRYLDARQFALARLQAACILGDRVDTSDPRGTHLTALVYAVNLGATPEAEAGWYALAERERERLAHAVNLFFSGGQETHLALCAMRTVGDDQSLPLIDQSVGDKREGTIQYGNKDAEPAWEQVRREAREAIRRRQSG
jgi:hypothetical protein